MSDSEKEIPVHIWSCGDCLWQWPLPGPPPVQAECDNCGGYLVEVEP